MIGKKRSFEVVMIQVALATALSWVGWDFVKAESTPFAALAGQVSSKEEGTMEGVLVSAKRPGSTVTITVASDAQGLYSFPRAKLEPGRYALRIRAVGYELEDPGFVEVLPNKAISLDLKLRKASDLAYQLSNAEWLLSMPGTEKLNERAKRVLLQCVQCHTLERVVRSRYNVSEFVRVMERMHMYASGSSPLRLQTRRAHRDEPDIPEQLAEFLSTINLSKVSAWQYPLKTLPRPKGRGTRVIITEYDLPRVDAMPHDAIVDSEGMVWYSDFGQQYLGRLDPKTAKVVEYAVPQIKPGFPTGANNVELDADGNLWLGMMFQGGIAKFHRKTQKFQTWGLPKDVDSDVAQVAMVMPRYLHLDGRVWSNNVGRRGIHRFDLRSGQIETFSPYREIPKDSPAATRPHSVYGIAADSQNNLYFMDYSSENIGRVDAKTGKITLYPIPTFNSAPRRGHMDSEDRLWFAEYQGNKIAMFDTKAEQFQEWAVPTLLSNPYDVALDKNGEAWTGGMNTDRVVRLNTDTGEFTEYLLPRFTNIRRVDVDNSTNPVTFWAGNNHGASIVRLEPLD